MDLELLGKVALVIGSIIGIGKGIALVLAEKGADIVLNGVNPSSDAAKLQGQIEAMGRKALMIYADVSDETKVKEMFSQIMDIFGRLDILVNNAGTTQAKDIFEEELANWDRIIRINLTSCFLCAKEAMKIMREQKYGRIIQVSSVVGHRGALFGHLHYAATKSGMFGFIKTLARTAAPYGITVNTVSPGIIETELLVQTQGEEGIKELIETVPLKALGTPHKCGLAITFLCGEGGDYITGADIEVNGGIHFH
jgi:NAD(P)-dependent dehydrogenase (short-subunit alcohol dehydrogenase family)